MVLDEQQQQLQQHIQRKKNAEKCYHTRRAPQN